jgi:succinate-semialdehyde dehydrogenase/glutarate-semialdehyde dehydrogenase
MRFMSSTIETINPATGRRLASYRGWDAARIEDSVALGHRTALAWGQRPLADRVHAVRQLAVALRGQKKPLATLMSAEMGKPLRESEVEVEKSAVTAEYYVQNAQKLLSDEPVQIEGVDAWVSYEPIGLVLAVMPWNFPLWQVMRFALPSLVAGNGVLLKHSPNVTGSALAIERLLVDAGLPAGLLTSLVIAEPEVPSTIERLIHDDRVAAVTLTGSNRAGAAVGATAGKAAKKSVLELGGSDAFIVLQDADVEAAAAAAVRARFHNAGQSCVCAKRFVVAESVAKRFTELFVAGAAGLKMGDPLDPRTDIGPMARRDLLEQLHAQVVASVARGARLLLGGAMPSEAGNYYSATVLADTGPGMPVFDEETFGPAAAIAVAKGEDDIIALANASPFGLSVSVWTGSKAKGIRVAKQITSGAAFINAVAASDARLPFGGTKRSGYGRELAAAGAREFTNIRTYWVASDN